MLPAQTSYVDASLKRNSYFQGRRLSRKFSRKAGIAITYSQGNDGKEQSAGDADEQFVGMSCILRAVGIGKRLRIGRQDVFQE